MVRTSCSVAILIPPMGIVHHMDSVTIWPLAALLIYGVYLLTAFGIRSWLQLRATGDSGFRGINGRPGSPEWFAGVLFVVAVLVGIAGPVAGLFGLGLLSPLEHTAARVAGLTLAIGGVALTLVAQRAMGPSWRVGVDDSERTELVTDGLFALVRNPVFSAMMLAGIGLALMVPNPISLIGLLALILAIHLQVRIVEEPYLNRVQGEIYVDYAGRVGRFVPGLGRRR